MEISLKELEGPLSAASQRYDEKLDAYEAAQEKTAAAVRARDEIFNKYGVGNPSAQCMAEIAQADQFIKAAQEEERKAELEALNALRQVQTASNFVNKKKKELRLSRSTDTTFVVYQARIECSFGMRESYLTLKSTHGVMTGEIPQMTVRDTKLNTNIINFGGCRSMENPSVQEAADRAGRNAKKRIEDKKDWRDTAAGAIAVARVAICPAKAIVEHFCSVVKKEDGPSDSLMSECVGTCTACFPANAIWENGHGKVKINGEPVLLRRCTMRCNWGGRITILLSGQPE